MTLHNYLSYVDYLVKSTEILFQQIPPDKIDWKPTENSFTIGQQLAHMVGAVEVYSRGITTGDWGFKTIRERFLQNRRTPSVNVEEALKHLTENHAVFKRLVGGLSEEDFNSGEIDSPQLGGKFPRWRVAMLFVEHHLNHKAELFMYLKLLGVKVNSGHLYRS
ncbi:MAG: DinB family protein [Bacteroidota bacterium]